MTFITSTSASGALHSSRAEAEAADRLDGHRIKPYDAPLPSAFKDKEGVICKGRSDFLDEIFGIWIELKVNHLNSKTSKATSDSALLRLEKRIRERSITPGSQKHRWELLQCGWNHSAYQIAAKQDACDAAGHPYLVLFTQKPDAETLKLLAKRGILWVQEGDDAFRQLMSYRKLHSTPGITVTSYRIKDCLFTPETLV